jgi:hypothetical protein
MLHDEGALTCCFYRFVCKPLACMQRRPSVLTSPTGQPKFNDWGPTGLEEGGWANRPWK